MFFCKISNIKVSKKYQRIFQHFSAGLPPVCLSSTEELIKFEFEKTCDLPRPRLLSLMSQVQKGKGNSSLTEREVVGSKKLHLYLIPKKPKNRISAFFQFSIRMFTIFDRFIRPLHELQLCRGQFSLSTFGKSKLQILCQASPW